MKYLVVILVIALGVAGIVYGGVDDSSGGHPWASCSSLARLP